MTQKSAETEDLRVQRTRKIIQEAFIALTVEKGFAAITVRDITERARVNRSTFYRHYLDKYDLMEKLVNDVNSLIWKADAAEHQKDIPARGPVILFRHVQQFADFYRVMLGPKGDPAFLENFRQNVEDRFHYLIENSPTPNDPKAAPVGLKIRYVSYADVGAVLWWLDNGQPCTPEQLAQWLAEMIWNGIGVPPPMPSTTTDKS